MNRSRRPLLATLVALAVVAPASPAGAAFGPAQALPLAVGGQLAAAVRPDGAATVAGVLAGAPVQARIEVATRATAGAPWRVAGFGTSAGLVRDVQVANGRRATVLAWSEVRRRSQTVVVATADAGARLTVRERVPVVSATSAFPRLATLPSGAVVVAWRDGRSGSRRARVRVATFDGERFASAPRTVGTDAAQVVLAARGAGAAVGWVSAQRPRIRKTRLSVPRAQPRTLTVRALDARGRPAGGATVAGRDVDATARFAGAPDGRLVASWVRPQKIRPYPNEDRGDAPPPSAYVNPVAFTRQVLPRLLPARPLGGPARFAVGIPSVAFDGPAHAVAAFRASVTGGIPAFDALTAAAVAGGPWSSPQLVSHLGFSRFDPVVVAPASGPVVVSTAAIQVPGPPNWAVTASGPAGPQLLGTTTAGDGRGLAVARSAERVLVAWRSSAGGVQISEQG